jgi:hypothetical protein
MNRHRKSSVVLASVMAMILAIPGAAWADSGRYGNDWNKGGKGNQKYSSGHYNNHYNNYYKGSYKGYYKGGPGYYPNYYGCNNCGKNKSHHDNNNSNDKLWIGLLGGGILGYALSNVVQNNTNDEGYYSQPVATPPRNVGRYEAPYEAPYADNTCLQEREYRSKIMVGGKQVDGYGTACLQPDGSWRYGQAQAETY